VAQFWGKQDIETARRECEQENTQLAIEQAEMLPRDPWGSAYKVVVKQATAV